MDEKYDIYNNLKIEYDYYSINAQRSFSIDCPYEFLFKGAENNPNLILYNGSKKTSYISTKFYIFSKNHLIEKINKKSDYNGELIIENIPITNSSKKSYLIFPLMTQKLQKDTIIDTIINETDLINNTNINVDVNFNEILPQTDNCIYYNTGNEEVIVFKKPILVTSKFDKITSDCKIISNYDFSTNYKLIDAVSKNYFPENISEHFTNDYSSYLENNSKPKVQQYLENILQKFNKGLSFMFSGKIFSLFENSSPEEKKRQKILKLLKKNRKLHTPDNWDITNKIENFVEGITMENDDEAWMECDNVPIDYSGEIASYTINASSKISDMNSNILLKTLQIFWIILFIVALYFSVPLLYGFLAVRSIMNINISFTEDRRDQITGLEIALSFLILLPSIILLIYGYANSVTDENGVWVLKDQLYINCVVSGGILLFFWIMSFVIIFIKKIQDPNFLGYQDGNINTPYYTFGKKVDISKGFSRVFSSLIALFK